MTEAQSNSKAEPAAKSAVLSADMPALAVLGFSNRGSDDWARLRGLQFTASSNNASVRLAGHLAGSVLLCVIALPAVGVVAVGVWFALFMCAMVFSRNKLTALCEYQGRPTPPEVSGYIISGSLVCTLYAIVPMAIGWYGTASQLMLVWAVLGALIAGSALFLAAVPVTTAILTSLASISTIAAAIRLGEPLLAGAVAMFACLILVGSMAVARTFLLAQIAQDGSTEKDEVVNLLLGQFDDNQGDWLWQIDRQKRTLAASSRFSMALGKTPEDINGKPFLELLAGDAWESGQFSPSLHDLAEKLKQRENFADLVIKVDINGKPSWWELSGAPIFDDEGTFTGFRGVGSDVTEQRESNEKIAYLARYDTLTGLPNRLMLNEALRDALKFADQWRTRCAFMMLDLDRFKAVNDSLGHMVGDRLLAEVSSRLRDLMDESAICGRLGGDEFAIVIRDASDKGCVDRMAKRIIARLSQPYELDNHTLYVGASVGSAIGPRDGHTVEELMRNADLALYRAKDEGGGEHFAYEPSLHQHAEERRKLEFSLRTAIENGELSVHYQPVVNANSEQLMSFEALVRWNSKDHGFVGPDKFIPVAEDTRLIVPIGTWVMEQACAEAMTWPGEIRVAVNVSGEQLVEPGFANTVVRALTQTGLPPARLELEVTESIFLRDPELARTALEQCIAIGCTVALDDFGTGYSSLGYLNKLKFSTIKIDRSFVQGAAKGEAESLAIIRAVVAMADSLEMWTTAEGVENDEEAEMIRKLGCTKIQGYHFGRPMPTSDVAQLFQRQAALSA